VSIGWGRAACAMGRNQWLRESRQPGVSTGTGRLDVAAAQRPQCAVCPGLYGEYDARLKHDFAGYIVGGPHAGFVHRPVPTGIPRTRLFQEAYHLLNASAWLEHGKWKLTFAGTNLTDTSYNTVFWPVPDVNPVHNIARVNRRDGLP